MSPTNDTTTTTEIALASVARREGQTTWRQNMRCVNICFLVSLASMQYGLDLSVINSAQALKGFLKVFGYPDPRAPNGYGITTQFQQAITSMMNVGVIVGSLALGPCAHLLGRRYVFFCASLACFIANTILIASTNHGAIIFGRFVFGVSNGFFTGFANIYISEAAPSHLRGSLVSFQQLTVCIGTVIGTCVNYATKRMESRLSYQIPLFVLYAVPLAFCILPFVLPESPRWLVLKGRHDEARAHLGRLRGSAFGSDILDAELITIEHAVAAEHENTFSKAQAFRLMFSKRERLRTMLTVAAATFHGASGFPFISSYATYFFQVAGSTDAFRDSIIVTTVSVLGAFAGVTLHRYLGRRPMLMFAFSSQAVLMAVIGAVWAAIPRTTMAGKVIVAMVVIFQCDFSAACGPGAFICAGEIPNNRLRAATYGVAHAVGFLSNFVISLTTPYFINPSALNIGPKVGFIWAASNFVTFVFVCFCLPETHRRTLENIDEMFYAKVPLRKFKEYKCSGIMHGEEAVYEKATVENLEDTETQPTGPQSHSARPA